MAFKTDSWGDLSSVMEHWMSHGLVPSPVKLSEWRSLHSFQRLAFSLMAVWLTWAMRDICSGSNIRLRAHKKHLMPQKPFFPLAWNRNNNAAKTCGSVIWCCCHCFLYTCAGVNRIPPAPQCYGWEESISKPQLSLHSTRVSCQSLTRVVMHFCQYSDSVGIFLPPKPF